MSFLAKVWLAALLAAAVGRGLLILIGTRGSIQTAAMVLSIYAVVFFGLGMAMNLPEAKAATKMISRRFGAK
jgi:hypothetical protein